MNMNKIIAAMLSIFIIASFGFTEFKKSDRNKLDKDLIKIPKKLPQELTSKAWKKKKRRFFDKKTGIGGQLKSIEKTFDEVLEIKKKKGFNFPDIYSDEINKPADFTNALKKARDNWKELKSLFGKLEKLEELIEEWEDHEKIRKKLKAYMKEVKDKTKDLAKDIKDINPEKWRKKFKKEKKDTLVFFKGIDELKRKGLNNPRKLKIAVTMLDIIFGDALVDICKDYQSKVVPELENLRDNPAALAAKFNQSYLANDAGSRAVSQNTTNIKIWKKTFGINFLYSTNDISQVIEDFDGWGGGTVSWTEDDAVASLDTYIRHLTALNKWVVKYSAQWAKDKSD